MHDSDKAKSHPPKGGEATVVLFEFAGVALKTAWPREPQKDKISKEVTESQTEGRLAHCQQIVEHRSAPWSVRVLKHAGPLPGETG